MCGKRISTWDTLRLNAVQLYTTGKLLRPADRLFDFHDGTVSLTGTGRDFTQTKLAAR